MPTLRMPPAQANDIAKVCSIGNDKLSRIAAGVAKMARTIDRDKIRSELAKLGPDIAEPLDRVIFGLAIAARRRFDTMSTILDNVVPPTTWDDARRARWEKDLQACRPALEQLLSAESIILAAKAIDLSFDVERFCVASRIITDIRPVFDAERSEIIGSTIRHTLRLEYTGIDGTVTSVSVGLDADDIAHLKDACEEATLKVEAAKRLLEKSGVNDVIIPGEETTK
jgi:hypothetical protein